MALVEAIAPVAALEAAGGVAVAVGVGVGVALAVGVGVGSDTGANSSALEEVLPLLPNPPAASTIPLGSNVAV